MDSQKLKISGYFEENQEMMDRFLHSTQTSDIQSGIEEVLDFELITLQLGIDRTNFEIDWFERLKCQLLKQDGSL